MLLGYAPGPGIKTESLIGSSNSAEHGKAYSAHMISDYRNAIIEAEQSTTLILRKSQSLTPAPCDVR
jgi:hypothetical protein